MYRSYTNSRNLKASGDVTTVAPVEDSEDYLTITFIPYPTTTTTNTEPKQETKAETPNEPIINNCSPSPTLITAAAMEQPTATATNSAVVDISCSQTQDQINSEEAPEKKKEEDKLTIYKALAIKLKKELVKSRDELQKLRIESFTECKFFKEQANFLEKALMSERHGNMINTTTLQGKVSFLTEQLRNADADLDSLQTEYENYKVRASKIMQQNNLTSTIDILERERMKELKDFYESQKVQISKLESQLSIVLDRNRELEAEKKLIEEQLEINLAKVESFKTIDNKCELLSRENENLKLVLKQFRSKLKEPASAHNCSVLNCDESNDEVYEETTKTANDGDNSKSKSLNDNIAMLNNTAQKAERSTQVDRSPSIDDRLDENLTRISPTPSVKDDSQTNSSPSIDGSTSGYVHIKPAAFEIISRSSVLEDAENQIDNLTKAYLDSESTNSLLTEQIRALKEEIRRLQRGTERLDLAENLEYLKNVVFKFISLDSGQAEQKQRLVPVLSTVLKLSPDETAKLNSLATVDKPSMASSFFKL